MALLEVRNLVTQFHTGAGVAKALDDVSFTLEKGKVLGIVGESGSGKSVTAFSLMNLIDAPGRISGGEIIFKGENLREASAKRWSQLRGDRIAMVFQDPMMSLNPVMRIGAQLGETIAIHRKASRREIDTRVCDALRRVGIPAPEERMRVYPHEMSGGMRQRVAIANAIINHPDLIIADEPTTALDVTIQAQILYEMKQLARESGTALIWITHDISVVKDLADDLCVMYAGRIIERGPVQQVIQQPLHPYTRGLIDSLPQAEHQGKRLYSIPGATPPLLRLPPGCAFAPRCSRAERACQTIPPVVAAEGREHRCFYPLSA
ncbi:methionine ABC transporter ATP-binding protein [Herbaspirillum rubrisubalbicans]|uniref:Methionine ABC transporter ATP-binding protein n=1 Tax=Herbaspirillum rubrisubalbicans TaxID=80842 RepID=A0ABX9C7U0_9BURK|nr:ABC transporter ATP-binding protein [Herbaspirillum rubrisubalbicans]MCP1572668.1 peptide/nickel transport system ATP-binding protein [Herbaspirillum rubrisubalbicans]RAM67005.1 methionine ABC transporter ATP-binding protein [Herbaspirillum rubrisubalbicans]RAN49129.1 methionine ABC transporter ATP-binding protein [Herbaspirillum rubrisubalbicans]